MSKSFRFLPGFLLILATVLAFPSFSEAADPHVSIRILPEKTQVKGGETVTIGIEETITPGWHTYWSNPGDSGTAARIKWQDGITAGPMQWPVPEKLPMGPLVNFGYKDKVVLLQDLTLPERLPSGPFKMDAKIDILVCDEICIPESHDVSFTINGNDSPVPSEVEMARNKLPLEMGWATSVSEENGDLKVSIKTDTPGAFTNLKSIELYPEEWGLISNTDMTRAEKDASSLTLHHKRGERALSEVPVSRLVIAYEDAAGQRKGLRVSTIDQAIPTEPAQANTVGVVQAILLAFLGGLILNLMPCVFPVLSMKALSLVQLKDKDIRRARIHGLAYTFGILACFAVIAGVLMILKAGGTQVGWGFQLQHPAIILFLAYLFFTLGLNLAGYFEIDFGLSNAGASLTKKTGLTGSFFTGVLATLVATPCTAPFMGVAMGYALTQPALIAMMIFLFLGLGLATPYLALTFIPAARHLLPRPGVWMEKFRQFLAFPMFASACWLVWVLSQQIDHMGQFAALLGMLSITLGIWFYKSRPVRNPGRIIFVVAALAAFAFTAYTFCSMKPVQMDATAQATLEKGDNWEGFTRARLEEYLKGDDAIFINMTAAWCITCKVNEKVALAIPSTQKLFEDNHIRYLKGDWTNQNPEITAFLEEYGRSGVPIYVYYAPKQNGIRPQPVVLPQILTPGIVEKTITGDKTP